MFPLKTCLFQGKHPELFQSFQTSCGFQTLHKIVPLWISSSLSTSFEKYGAGINYCNNNSDNNHHLLSGHNVPGTGLEA